jgi:hypothetical protein
MIIPSRNAHGVPTNYFYEEISKYLKILEHVIKINNLPRNKMMCPIEELNNPNRSIHVII